MYHSSQCRLCGKRVMSGVNEDENLQHELAREVKEQVEMLRGEVFPIHFKLKEEISSSIQEDLLHNNKYILFNKIAYFSLKSVEKRREIVGMMKSIERKKIKLMEKAIRINDKEAKIKILNQKKEMLEQELLNRRVTTRGLEMVNKALLFPLLDYSRIRQLVKAFSSIPLNCPNIKSLKFKDVDGTINVEVTGISYIVGIPLPNSGDYSYIPPQLVCSALTHITLLLCYSSKLLNIQLPHPILPMAALDFPIIRPCGDLRRHIPLTPAFEPPVDIQALTMRDDGWGPLPSSIKYQPDEVYYSSRFLPADVVEESSTIENLPWNSSLLDLLSHNSNIRAEESKLCSEENLDFEEVKEFNEECIQQCQLRASGVGWTRNEDFEEGLVLLQADIVHLCLAVGINPESMWPPQALLLNLQILQRFIEDKFSKCNGENKTVHVSSSYENGQELPNRSDRANSLNDTTVLERCLHSYSNALRTQAIQENVSTCISEREQGLNGKRVNGLSMVKNNIYCCDQSLRFVKPFDCEAFVAEEDRDDKKFVHVNYDYIEPENSESKISLAYDETINC